MRIQRNTLRTAQDFIDAVSDMEIGKEYVLTGYTSSERGGKTRWKKGTTKLTPVARRDVLLNAMTREEDAVREIVFLRHFGSPGFVNTKSEMYCYITQPKNGVPSLRFKGAIRCI